MWARTYPFWLLVVRAYHLVLSFLGLSVPTTFSPRPMLGEPAQLFFLWNFPWWWRVAKINSQSLDDASALKSLGPKFDSGWITFSRLLLARYLPSLNQVLLSHLTTRILNSCSPAAALPSQKAKHGNILGPRMYHRSAGVKTTRKQSPDLKGLQLEVRLRRGP